MECLNKMTEGLSEEEINTLHSLLMKIYENKNKGGSD
jgi:hypothetical protein